MAFTVTRTKTVFGDQRVVLIKIVTDGAEANIESGLSRIRTYALGYGSMTSRHITVAINSGSTGTAIAGMLGISGCATGDEFYLTVYGS